MILGEDNPPQSPMDAKSPSGPPTSQPPPSQYSQSAYGGPVPPPSYQQSYQSLYQNHVSNPGAFRRFAEPAGPRFLKAFGIAVAIWVLIGMLTSSVVDIGIRHGHIGWDDGDGNYGRYDAGPQPGDGEANTCISGYDWVRDEQHPPVHKDHDRWEVSTSFKLPSKADALYTLARGTSSHGVVEVIPGDHTDDVVKVEVTANYDWRKVIEESKVCILKRGGDEHGLGIFTPLKWDHQDRDNYGHSIRWKVSLVLPKHANIKSLSTHMPNFSHHLGELEGAADFGTLALEGTNAPIDVVTVHAKALSLHTTNSPIFVKEGKADNADLHTTNGPISGAVSAPVLQAQSTNSPIDGKFYASEKLVLHTTNSPIRAQVFAENDVDKKPTSVSIHTTNGHIETDVELTSTAKSGYGGAFDLSVATTNSPLTVNIPTSPADSSLNLQARTSNGHAVVSLPPAYEGSFVGRTSLLGARASVSKVEDPKGAGRERTVHWNEQGKNVVRGSVSWGGKGKGNVDVASTIAPVEIKL